MMSIRSVLIAITLNLGLIALPAAHATAYEEAPAAPTPEQTQWVKASVQQMRASGLPQPLREAPQQVEGRTQIMVSDAISVVELAHVDFARGAYYLSVHNPWTNNTTWYGEFALLK